MAFTAPVDIAKRALQHLGQPTITALTDTSRQAVEMNYCYPMLRQAELRRTPWTFAARRAVLRPRTSTSRLVVFAAWSGATTYAMGDIVKDSGGVLWISTAASNLNHAPGNTDTTPWWLAYYGPVAADVWASGNFFPGDLVYVSTNVYIAISSVGAPITTQNPTGGAPWHVVAGASLATMPGFDPIATWIAPSSGGANAVVRTIYDLPANFMRVAPQDERTAGTPRQVITAGMQFNDFEIEGKLLFSGDTGPKIFRFTADFTNVLTMEALFCELLAVSMARETCMILTGNRELEAALETRYLALLDEARTTSLIEAGSSELPPQPPPQQPATQSRGAPT